ncbi:MAG: hypothetical protein PVH12_03810 [Candidatus Bathyarchaeota archaeon]|jgi:hypothetical protein
MEKKKNMTVDGPHLLVLLAGNLLFALALIIQNVPLTFLAAYFAVIIIIWARIMRMFILGDAQSRD